MDERLRLNGCSFIPFEDNGSKAKQLIQKMIADIIHLLKISIP
jgi:hypothetical protein